MFPPVVSVTYIRMPCLYRPPMTVSDLPARWRSECECSKALHHKPSVPFFLDSRRRTSPAGHPCSRRECEIYRSTKAAKLLQSSKIDTSFQHRRPLIRLSTELDRKEAVLIISFMAHPTSATSVCFSTSLSRWTSALSQRPLYQRSFRKPVRG